MAESGFVDTCSCNSNYILLLCDKEWKLYLGATSSMHYYWRGESDIHFTSMHCYYVRESDIEVALSHVFLTE